MTLCTPEAVVFAILAHARGEAPNECCGLLVGGPDRIHRAVRARNVKASPTRYVVDPADHFAALRDARREGLSIVGAYHSHPGSPPAPSSIDLREAHETGFIYLIASTGMARRPDEVRAYRFVDGRFESLDLVVETT